MSNNLQTVTVQVGGESLYVFPISFNPAKSPSVYYVKGNESSIYANDEVQITIEKSPTYCDIPLWRRIWYVVVLRWFVALARWRKDGILCGGMFASFRVFYELAQPFVAQSVFDGRFSIEYQIAVNDPDRHVEDVYLTPSHAWIDEHFNRRLANPTEYDDPDEITAFLKWRESEYKKGNRIAYLISMNT